MKKILSILSTTFLAAVLFTTTACTQPAGTANSDGSKSAHTATPSPSAGAKTDPSMGAIKIASKPAGATVMLLADEGGEAGRPQMRGTSPTTVADLAPGKYTVHLELKGYKSFQKSVEVKAGETVPLSVNLQR